MTRPPAASPHEPPSGPQTRIIRREPTGSLPAIGDDTRTGIIRRAPTGRIPVSPEPAGTGPGTAVAACVFAILSGWTTSVVATSLITGWWNTDRLFCVAVGFLAVVFAAATITGIVLLLLRRGLGHYLIAVGSVVALLAFGGVFIAGAKIPGAVYAMPVLPVLSAALALHPATRRWSAGDRAG